MRREVIICSLFLASGWFSPAHGYDLPGISFAFDNAASVELQSEPTEFSLPGGIYSAPVDVTLTGLGEALIYFTLDGTIPTLNSTLYTSPILLSTTTAISSIAIEPGKTASVATTHTYLINEPVNLPVISIVTDPDNLFSNQTGIYVTGTNGIPGACDPVPRNLNQDWERPVNVEFFEKDGTLAFNQAAGIKIFGGCSRTRFPQKSFSLFARKMYGKGAFDYPLFPDKRIDKYESFLLRSSADDQVRTMFNDAFTAYVLKENMDLDYMAYRPVVVFINGQYWGIHNLREKVNEHYVTSNFGVAEQRVNLLQGNASPVFGDNSGYNQLISFISSNSLANTSNYKNVSNAIDIGQFIDYEIANIHLAEVDWPGNNIKFWNAPGSPYQKWRWILFDRDQTFQTYRVNTDALSLATASNGPNWPNPPWSTLLLRKLLDNSDFRNQFLQTYAYHLATTFESDRVGNILNQFKSRIEAEIPRHISRWGGQLDPDKSETWPSPTFSTVAQWESNVEAVRSFLTSRQPTAIQHLFNYFDVVERTVVTVATDDPLKGGVRLFDKSLPATSTVNYFKGIPLKLQAAPLPGFRFSHWEINGQVSTDQVLEFVPAVETTLVAFFEKDVVPHLPIVINEINYNSSENHNSGDWVELYNPNNYGVSVVGWTLRDSKQSNAFIIRENTTIPANGYLVICEAIDDFKIVFPSISNCVGGLGFKLSNGGDMVRLYDEGDELTDIVDFDDESPWPVLADGMGSSLELIDFRLDNSQAESWRASAGRGTPGRNNDETIVSVREFALKLNEVYPNPTRGVTSVSYSVSKRSVVALRLFNIWGQEIETLVNMDQTEGYYRIDHDFGGLQAGIYFLVFQSDVDREVHKVVVAR